MGNIPTTAWDRVVAEIQHDPKTEGLLPRVLVALRRRWRVRPLVQLLDPLAVAQVPAQSELQRSSEPRLLVHLSGPAHIGGLGLLESGQGLLIPAQLGYWERITGPAANLLLAKLGSGLYLHLASVGRTRSELKVGIWRHDQGGDVLDAIMLATQAAAPLPPPLPQQLAERNLLLLLDLVEGLVQAGPAAMRQQSAGPRPLATALGLIAERAMDPNLSVAAIAAQVGLHPSSLTRLSRLVTGRGILEHLTEARLRRAQLLMRDHRLSLAGIAERCGFASARALRRVFTQAHGNLPRQERRQGHW